MSQTVSEAVLNQLGDDIATTCQEKGFWDAPHPLLAQLNTKLLLVVSEVIEAQEVLRNGRTADDVSPDYLRDVLSVYQAEKFFEELADVVIRVLDVCGHFGWNVGETLLAKVTRNNHRPHKHGKAF